MNLNKSITISIDTPYVSLEEYARRTGQTREAVKQQCKRGKLPVAPRENQRTPYMVNLLLLFKQADQRDY